MHARIVVVVAIAAAFAAGAFAADQPVPKNVLYLTVSEAFAHSPIVERRGNPCWSERVLRPIFEGMGAKLTVTKDASTINAENLKNYDLVMFYTQGDLTKPNKVGAPPMGPNGQAELIAWIEDGGHFLGFHSATDTFDVGGEEITPYIEMIGGEFRGHGKQFVGKVDVVDPDHPTAANIPDGWELREEWYLFRKFNTDAIHVVALVDPGPERENQEMYDIAPYPVIWLRTLGEGRVYFTALGHRKDVWTNDIFKQSVVDAVHWLMSDGPARAEPNYNEVVPKEAPREGSAG